MSINNTINKIYKSKTYFQKYGLYVWVMVLILFIFFILLSYLFYTRYYKLIKANWDVNKCKPNYIFWSGWITKPADQNEFEATANNYNECVVDLLSKIRNMKLMPAIKLSNMQVNSLGNLNGSLKKLSTNLSLTKIQLTKQLGMVSAGLSGLAGPGLTSTTSSGDETETGTGGVLFKSQYVFMDIFNKLTAIFPIISHFITSILYTIQSFFVSAYKAFNGLLIICTPIIVAWTMLGIALFLFPEPTMITKVLGAICIVIALTFFVLFLIIAVGALMYNEFLMLVFNVNATAPMKGPKKPGKPSCFDEDTIIVLKENKEKYIKDIVVGDVLHDGSTVTAFMKCKCDKKMYTINKICVSESHLVYNVETNSFVKSSKHPLSIFVPKYNKPYIYCISTSNKIIKIKNHIFTDWDELTYLDREKLSKDIPYNKQHLINGGLTSDTKIPVLHSDEPIPICLLKPGMVLKNNGIVEAIIKTESLDTYLYSEQKIKGSNNLVFKTNNKVLHYGKEISKKWIGKQPLYHIISSNNLIQLSSCKLYDYNSIMDIWFNEDIKQYIDKNI